MKIDAPKRSIAKTLSWRVISLTIVFFVSLVVTKSATIAVSISAFDAIIKMAVYYLHERMWTHVRWGRLKHKKPRKAKKNKHVIDEDTKP